MPAATQRVFPVRDSAEALAVLRDSLRYDDLRALGGKRGLALTWCDPWYPGEAMRTIALTATDDAEAAALSRMTLGGGRPLPWSAMDRNNMGKGLALVCPGPSTGEDLVSLTMRDGQGQADTDSVAAVRAAFRGMARDAVRDADIPDGMRSLLEAAMDFGVALGAFQDVPGLWREAGRRAWDVEELCVTHPMVGVAALRDTGFRGAVRHGATCAEALAETWPGLTRAHMRRLRGGPIPPRQVEEWSSRSMALALCETVPPDWVPEGEAWKAFNIVAATHHGLPAGVRRWGGAGLYASAKGDWHGFLCRLKPGVRKGSWTSDGSWGRALARESGLLGDAPWHAMTTLVQPLLSHEGLRRGLLSPALATCGYAAAAGEVAYGLTYGDKCLPGVFAASRSWHAREQAIQANIAGIGDDVRWPALFEPFAHMGMLAVPICDAVSLREEGAAGLDRQGVPGMDHCVATRLPLLLAGRSHVLSIRRVLPGGGYERLSTFQVRVADDGGLVDEEHQARGNFLPGIDAQVMAFALKEAVEDGRLQFRPEAMARAAESPGKDDVVAALAGYDWRDPAQVAGAILAWEPCLPRWMRGLDPARAYDALVAHGLLPGDWAASVAPCDETDVRLRFDGH